MMRFNKKYILFVFLFLFSVTGFSVKATTTGEVISFNVESDFDSGSRSQLPAVLVKTAPNIYFYVEKSWWDMQPIARQNEILATFDALSGEFDRNIYPTLTSVFGSEWKPGVDSDPRVSLLFEGMKDGVAGYFRSTDEYIKLQAPESNEREMVYLSLANIDSPQLKVFLAHEFTHLITFNQKNRLNNIQEEVWLNEARADYASTILGYDNSYDGSNLQKRVRDFLANPSDSLTEWQDKKYDYAVANVFMHYLADHYSVSILANSLKSKLVGIPSINEALFKAGVKEDFSQIFTNWVVANIINNCTSNLQYCYLNQNLKNLRISPTLNFLPLTGNSSLSVTNITKNWAGNWQKIIGGSGDLTLEFSSLAGLNFQVPYIVFDKDNNSTVNFLKLDKQQKGQITIKNFGEQYNSLIIMPLLESKTTGFDGAEFTYPYTFKVSISGQVVQDDPVVIQNLLAQIESLKKQIADLQNGTGSGSGARCSSFAVNLSVGLTNNSDVSCLQAFLASQGGGIYPEALVTGYFGPLTKAAVIRFQQRWLIPATGFVGPLTRAKINGLNW